MMNQNTVEEKLCFFCEDKLSILERPRGSMTRHEAKVLHGVTSVRSGVRKSMFIVDQNNGLGETDEAILGITLLDVRGFLRSRESSSDIRNCIICFDNEPNVVTTPCDHLCLCSECSDDITDRCPKCRRLLTSKIAYL